MYADAQSHRGLHAAGCTPPKNFGGMFKSTDGGATWSTITGAANAGGQLNGCQCGYDQTIGVDPVDAEQGLHRLPGALVLVERRRQLREHQRRRHPLGSPRARLQPAEPPHERRHDDSRLDRHGRRYPLHGRRRRELRRSATARSPRTSSARWTSATAPATTTTASAARRTRGRCVTRPSDGGTEWHEAVDADGGPMAVDWQDPDNAFGISNGQFIRTTNGGDSWIRPGSGDIDCVTMTAGAAPSIQTTETTSTCRRTTAPTPTAVRARTSQGTGIFRSTDGGATFAGADFVATPADARGHLHRDDPDRQQPDVGRARTTVRSRSRPTSTPRRRASRRRP